MSTASTPAVFAVAGATFEVLDSDNTPLGELYVYPPPSPEPESSSANSSEVNSAGMQSMSSNATGTSADAVCSKNAFLLPLQLGQNDFSVAVTALEPAEQVSKKQLCILVIAMHFHIQHPWNNLMSKLMLPVHLPPLCKHADLSHQPASTSCHRDVSATIMLHKVSVGQMQLCTQETTH